MSVSSISSLLGQEASEQLSNKCMMASVLNLKSGISIRQCFNHLVRSKRAEQKNSCYCNAVHTFSDLFTVAGRSMDFGEVDANTIFDFFRE